MGITSILKDQEKPKGIKKAYIQRDRIYLSFINLSNEEFRAELDIVRSLPGRQWHAERKEWSLPLNLYNAESLSERDYELGEDIKNWITERAERADTAVEMPEGVSLYPFQQEGVRMLEERNGRALLADEPGLGKSVQAIAYMKMHPELRPALLVVPASLKINWTREFKKWGVREDYTVVYGRSMALKLQENIVIINYDILKDYVDVLEEMAPKLLIMDESHMCKNNKTIRTKTVKYLAKNIEHIICISGTPIVNRPAEFFTTLNILAPEMFGNWWRFANEYCGSQWEGYKGATNTEKLNKVLMKSIMIRRLKEDVLKELPPKQVTVIPMEINNRGKYEKAEQDLIQFIRETEGDEKARRAMGAETLVRMGKLKQLSVEGKMSEIIEWVESFIDAEKLVVFCIHHKTIDSLMEKFGPVAVKLDGRDSVGQKQKSIDSFQTDDKIRLFVGNIKAAGTGITLTAASNLAFIELDWVPGNHDQASDRVHRIGSTAESINIYYLVGLDTIEEDMAKMIDKKRKVLSEILNGEEPEEDSLLTVLIEKYRGMNGI